MKHGWWILAAAIAFLIWQDAQRQKTLWKGVDDELGPSTKL